MIRLKTTVLNTSSGQNGCCIYMQLPYNADSIEFFNITLPYTQYLQDYNFLFRQSEMGSNPLSCYVQPMDGDYVYHNSNGELHFYTGGTPLVNGTIKFNTDGSVLINGAEVKAADGNDWIFSQGADFRLFTDEWGRFLSNATVGEIKLYSSGNAVMDLWPYYDDVNQEVMYVDIINDVQYHNTGTGTLEVGEIAPSSIKYVDWISITQLENITWPASMTKYYDTGMHFSSNTKIRYKCYYEGYTNHIAAIGTPNNISHQFSVFWYPETIYIAINGSDNSGSWSKVVGDFIDFTVDNCKIWDNGLNTLVLSANTASEFVNNNDTILIDVQTARFHSIEIYENNVLVFNGKAAYDSLTGKIGVYDEVSSNLIVNSALTMTKGADLSTINVNVEKSNIDSTEQTVNITVNSNSDWTASTSANYVTFVSGVTSGTSADTSITINVQANSGATKRNFTIEFVNGNGDTAELDISQGYPINKFIFADWIEADAHLGTSWIDTGIYPDMDTEIEATVMNMKNDASLANRPIIGNNESKGMSLRDRLQLYLMGDFGDVEEQGWYQELYMPYMEKRHILFNSTGLTVTGENYEAYKHYTATSMTGTSTTIHINGHSGNGTTNSYRYGEVIIRKNGSEVWHGVPCVYGNQVGMYDLVTSYFFAGEGTRPFQAIDQNGYITFGTDDFDNLMIGEDKVKRLYMGNKIFYVEAPFVGLSIKNASLGMESGSSTTIKVRSSEPWTLSVDSAATWLNVSPLSGNVGETTVTLTATSENNTGSARTTTLTATSNSFSATCEVEQIALHYVKCIYTQSMSWDSSKYIDTQVMATTATTMRIGYVGAGIGSDRVIGYAPQDGTSDNDDWRYFNGFSDTNTVDLNSSRKQGGSPTRQSGVEYDITLGNNYLYDNINESYIVAQGNVQSSLTPMTIRVDVGSQKVKFVEIKDNGVTVFYGRAAVDDANNIIGLYDSISNTWKYNSALTMSYEELPPQVQDAISVSGSQVDNSIDFSGSFISATYNSIWEVHITDMMYNNAINNNEDPTDINWIIARGQENGSVSGNTFIAAVDVNCSGDVHSYFFLYDNVNDVVSTATTWDNTYYGNGNCGEEPTPQECQEWQVCGCCDGSGTIWDEELQEDVMCECCGGMGGSDMIVPCPEE